MSNAVSADPKGRTRPAFLHRNDQRRPLGLRPCQPEARGNGKTGKSILSAAG